MVVIALALAVWLLPKRNYDNAHNSKIPVVRELEGDGKYELPTLFHDDDTVEETAGEPLMDKNHEETHPKTPISEGDKRDETTSQNGTSSAGNGSAADYTNMSIDTVDNGSTNDAEITNNSNALSYSNTTPNDINRNSKDSLILQEGEAESKELPLIKVK